MNHNNIKSSFFETTKIIRRRLVIFSFFLDFQIRHFQLFFFNVLTQNKELWDAPENQISEMNVMERIFGDDIFESRIIEEIFPVNVPENILTALNPAILTHDE